VRSEEEPLSGQTDPVREGGGRRAGERGPGSGGPGERGAAFRGAIFRGAAFRAAMFGGATGPKLRGRLIWRAILWRTLLFALLWWAVAEGRPLAPQFALLGVVGAVLGSLALRPPLRWRARGTLQLTVFFVVKTVRAGVDVARRALDPRARVGPRFVQYRLRATDPYQQVLLSNVISLMPGTLSCELREGVLTVHLLISRPDALEGIAEVECRVLAALIGQDEYAEPATHQGKTEDRKRP
jgi:multicomponent Na+:H+ antiporter subunit E